MARKITESTCTIGGGVALFGSGAWNPVLNLAANRASSAASAGGRPETSGACWWRVVPMGCCKSLRAEESDTNAI